MEFLPVGEDLIKCPYEDAHRIRRKRMERHLVLCRKNHTDKKLIKCDFNSTHEVPEPELQYHYEICSDRKNIEIAIYKEKDPTDKDSADPYPIKNLHVPVDDSWDDHVTGTYNPKEYCDTNPVLVRLDVEAPSKKKDFHLEQRAKFSQLEAVGVLKTHASQELNPVSIYDDSISDPEARQLRQTAGMLEKLVYGSKNVFLPKH